jgi:hypothetical protein
MHERAHNEALTEKRGKVIITRGMNIKSHSLGLSGKCDVLEFHENPNGITLFGWEGRYLPFPIEYKHGEAKGEQLRRCSALRTSYVFRGKCYAVKSSKAHCIMENQGVVS